MKLTTVNWTNASCTIILFALVFLVYECQAQVKEPAKPEKTVESLDLREAKEARESAEKRVLELELELEKLRKDYDALRSRYAGLYLESHDVIDKMKNLEISAANLLRNKNASSSGSLENEAMEAMSLSVSRQIAALDELKHFEKYISSLMDVLQPSTALKSELDKRVSDLKKSVELALKPLSTVARRGSGGTGKSNCDVIAVSVEMQLVILNRGFLSGVRPGKRWHLNGPDGKIAATLVTVDSRPEISAAVLLEGDIEALNPGSSLLPDL